MKRCSAILCLTFAIAADSAQGSRVTRHELLVTPAVADGLLDTPENFAEIVPPRARPVEGLRFFTELLHDLYATFEEPPPSNYFFTTVYYTPRESGFTEERGFNMASMPMKGAGGRRYPADFVRAVVLEGFGQLAEPVDGKAYLAYNGRLHNRILGNRNNTLVPRESIAVYTRNPLVRSGRKVWVLDPEVYNQFGAALFRVADTGGGLFHNQIDLYWGEDDPKGPGSGVARAASCDLAVNWIVPVIPHE